MTFGAKRTIFINDDVEKSVDSFGIFYRNTSKQLENKSKGLRNYKAGANAGQNSAVPTTEITIAGGLPANGINRLTFLDSAVQIAIASTDSNDTSAGTGAQTVKLMGLDSNFDEISETLTMNGLTKVTSSLTYLRFQNLMTITVGSNNFNVGNIYIGDDADTFTSGVPDTDILYTMGSGTNIARCAIYTVPNGYDYYPLKVNVDTDATESKPASFKSYNTQLGAVTRLLSNNIFSSSTEITTPSAPLKPTGTDLELTVQNLGAGTISFQAIRHFVLEDIS